MKPDNKPKIRFNRPLLPFLVGLLLILQLVIPYQGWLILLVGLGGGWMISALWARSLAHGLALQREIRPAWLKVGDTLAERFWLANRGWARGTGLLLIDHSTLPDYPSTSVISLEGGTEKGWTVRSLCRRRGLFTLGPLELRTADPLGLYTVILPHPQTSQVLVTPRIVHLPTIQVAPGGRTDDGRLRHKALEPTASVAGLREYFPGASARTIHWPSSARRDALYVRHFDSTPAGDWWIVLDMDAHAQAGRGDRRTEEHAIILAASLADRGLQAGRAVGLLAHGATLTWRPPQVGDPQRWQILRDLALLEPGDVSLTRLLGRVRTGFGRRTSLIVITPALDGAWIGPLLGLKQNGLIPTVLLLDPRSFIDPTETGLGRPPAAPARLATLGIRHYLIGREMLDVAVGEGKNKQNG